MSLWDPDVPKCAEWTKQLVVKPFSTANLSGKLLICAAGFEDRARAVVQNVADERIQFSDLFVLTYDVGDDEKLRRENQRTEDLIRDHLGQLLLPDSAIPVWIPVPQNEGEKAKVRTRLEDRITSTGHSEVVLDISGMSGTVMGIALGATRSLDRVHVVYSEAANYYPFLWQVYLANDEADEAAFIERGIGRTVTLPEFIGQLSLQKHESTVVATLGFSQERLQHALEDLTPRETRRLIAIAGAPPITGRSWRLIYALHKNQGVIDSNNASVLCASTLWPHETLSILYFTWDLYAGASDITLVPLGSKMQTLAMILFAWANPECRLEFIDPLQYRPDRYSMGVGPIWQLELSPSDWWVPRS